MSRHPRSCLLSCLLYCLVLLPCLVCSSLLLLRTHARTHAHSSFLTSPHTHTPHSSLPPRARAGYGFSSPPAKRGFGVTKMAAAFDALMAGLGYPKYIAQGGDWGAIICRALSK